MKITSNTKFVHPECKYSYLPNIRTGPNNHTGWKKYEISIIVQVVINVQVGIFPRY